MASFMESPRFPDDISYGVNFGPAFLTSVATNLGGFETRNKERSRALCRGDCSQAVKTDAQLKTLVTFFRSVAGRFSGFRFKDWSDFTSSEVDTVLTLISGSTTQYQLNKLYQTATGFSELRPLRKPVTGTMVLKDGGVAVTVGTSTGQFTLDTSTGVITLALSQNRPINAHTIGASHKVTLASALNPQVLVGQKVAIEGVTGTAATVLNNILHTVTAVNLADVTIGTSTAGLTATGGVLNLYRQQATLTASLEFDTPCRFDTDNMGVRIDTFNSFTWGQIPIQEVRE